VATLRLWHKDLIPVLPRQQLLGQWRECCLIARSIQNNGTPNHMLVNKIMDYPIKHFWTYGVMVAKEMESRGYKCDFERFAQYFPLGGYQEVSNDDLFKDWHNGRYLKQCFANLQEKFDCGGVPVAQWAEVCYALKDRPMY
jgi:uncharacterized protein (TIGR02328 family)